VPALRLIPVLATSLVFVGLAGCATVPSAEPGLAQAEAAMQGANWVLLGEVHDNAAVHEARYEALRRAVERGWRPAIAMEQFDRERQADLDAARKQRPHDAGYLIAQASPAKSSWNWDYYRPVVALALQYDLPIVAANLSRTDASKVARLGYAAVLPEPLISRYRLDQPLDAALQAGQRDAIDRGHCGQLPAAVLDGMVKAQVARDVVMAEALRPYRERGAVLLAGNGHVRRDLGVPRWLAGTLSVGLVEQADAQAYDRSQQFAAAQRDDPCAAFGKRS